MRKIFTLKFILSIALLLTFQTINAQCSDADNDGVCDSEDQCAGYDDDFDIDDDGIPYYCDDCIDVNENGICDNDNDLDSFGDHKVYFSTKRGIFTNAFQLELISKDPNAQIRYTTNGSAPSASSGTLYSGPISINTTAYIRAVAYTVSEISKVYTHTYIFPNDVIDQPNSVSGLSLIHI